MAPYSKAPLGPAGTTIWRPLSLYMEVEKMRQRCVSLHSCVNEQSQRYYLLPEEIHLSVSFQVLIQGLQNLNRAVHQDVVAVQLLPQSQWVAPSSVILQDEGEAKDENANEEEDKVGFFYILCYWLWLAITN